MLSLSEMILFMNKYVDNNAFTEQEDIIYK
jgi:hypothetical protein